MNIFKKLPWLTIVATLVAWMLFWDLKETITAERTFFVYRWLYSDLAHAKDIEVKTYLLTNEQVSHMFAHPDEEIQQPTNRELRFKNVNAVLRFRNRTGGNASGTILWGIKDEGQQKMCINYIPTPEESKLRADFVVPMGIVIHKRNDLIPDPIVVEWEELYVWR